MELLSQIKNAHSKTVNTLFYIPHTHKLISGGSDGIIRLWEKGFFGQTKSVNFKGHKGIILDISFLDNNSFFASTATDGQIILREISNGKTIASVSSFKEFKNNLKVDIDSSEWAFLSIAHIPNTPKIIVLHAYYGLFIWNLQYGDIADFPSLELPLFGTELVLAEKRNFIITNSGKAIYILNMDDGKIIRVFGGSPKGVRKGHNMLVTGEENNIMSNSFERMGGHKKDVTCFSLSPNERYLLSGSFDCNVHRWDISEPSNIEPKGVKIMEGHQGAVTRVSFIPRSNLVASCSVDGTVRLWDSEKCEEVLCKILNTPIYTMAVSPTGSELAVGCGNGSIYIFSL